MSRGAAALCLRLMGTRALREADTGAPIGFDETPPDALLSGSRTAGHAAEKQRTRDTAGPPEYQPPPDGPPEVTVHLTGSFNQWRF